MRNLLRSKIKILDQFVWDHCVPWTHVERWLANFQDDPDDERSEQLHALYLLGSFAYFNSSLMRALLRALYRDFVQYPVLAHLRRRNGDTLDLSILEPAFNNALSRIRFVGIGNPSESGTHLLYYFRQENQLPTNLFVHPHEILNSTKLVPDPLKHIDHLIFLDDFCGSGTQAEWYSRQVLPAARKLKKRLRISYYPLFATSKGISKVRKTTAFSDVQTLCELDDSFRAIEADSRYFRESHSEIDREFAADMCERYGTLIEPRNPLGFGQCQLLLGFAHNIPNNTLPVFWSEGTATSPWTPIFRRYTKGIGW